jgi:uncharacterized membrane protein
MHQANEGGTSMKNKTAILLGALIAWCVTLVAFRVQRTSSDYFLFLIWNLFLACVPMVASRALLIVHGRRGSDRTQLGLVALWLLFLPNAPYILTDIVHLRSSTPLLYWFDAMMILSFAGTGLLIGYLSLFDVHEVVEQRFGQAAGWSAAAAALLLSGFGVYLGRVQRWNSWDIVTDPYNLFTNIAHFFLNPSAHANAYRATALLSGALLMGYAALRFLANATRNARVRATAQF